MALCIECGTHKPDGPGDCPACRARPVLMTPEMAFTEARLTAEPAARTDAPATATPESRLAAAALVVGALVFSLAVILTLASGLLRS
jgi:hypothetical protein